MANSFLTTEEITQECLLALENHLGFSKRVNRQLDKKFAKEGAKRGATIHVRKPTRYSVTDGPVLNIQDSADQYVSMTVDKQKHVGLAFASDDLALSIDDFRKRYIDNAIIPLANQIEVDLLAKYKSVYSFVGVPSETAFPSDLKGFGQAKALLADNGAPAGLYHAGISPKTEAAMIYGQRALFNPNGDLSKQWKKGTIAESGGCEFFMSQNIPMHLSGAVVGTPLIDTDSTASTFHLDGITGSISGCYKEGDVIQVAGVYAVNPVTKASTGELMRFVVTADTASVSNEIAALPISPSVVTSGAYQNVSAAPADGAAVTLFGHATNYASKNVPQNIVFHEDAFGLAMVDLPIIKGAHMCARASDEESGLSIRLWSDGDIINDRVITRLDVLYGVTCFYPELACRVVGQPA